MTRLFIAIDIPAPVREEIAGLGLSVPSSRPVPVEQLHLTLRFIGEVEGGRLLDIQGVLTEICHPHFSLGFKGVGTFPPRGTPRVLWAGVHPVKELCALRQSIDSKLAEISVPREKQKYSPHLTLARLDNPPLRHLQQFLAGNALLQTGHFTVQAFNLYKSQLTRRGAIHTILRQYPLQQRESARLSDKMAVRAS